MKLSIVNRLKTSQLKITGGMSMKRHPFRRRTLGLFFKCIPSIFILIIDKFPHIVCVLSFEFLKSSFRKTHWFCLFFTGGFYIHF